MTRVLRALLASGLLVFAIAVPALAVGLNPAHVGATDATFQSDCTSGTPDEGMTTWTFVHTTLHQAGDTLTATFQDAGVQVAIGFQPGGDSNAIEHYTITIPSGDTLLSASDNVTTGLEGETLNLSHVCVGPPPPEIPEVPFALILPLVAIATFGGYLLIQRRRPTVV